jgi:hypothetical protein
VFKSVAKAADVESAIAAAADKIVFEKVIICYSPVSFWLRQEKTQ